MTVPSEFLKAAETAYAKPSVRINRRLGDRWKPGPGEELLEKLQDFIKVNAASVGDIPFALRLHQQIKAGSTSLSLSHLTNFITGKLILLEIDETLGVFESQPLE